MTGYEFRRRLPRLDGGIQALPGCIRSWAAIILVGLAFIPLGSLAAEPGPPAAPAPALFELTVVGPDGKPVLKAAVEIHARPLVKANQIKRGQFNRQAQDATHAKTDDEGRLTFETTSKPGAFTIETQQPGFGPYWATWKSEETLPKSFTAELDAGWVVGGVVVDEDGNPIENVTVEPSLPYKKRAGDTSELYVGTSITTDFDGKWRYRCIPDSKNDIFVEFNHPDYKPEEISLARGKYAVPAGAEPEAKITMRRGPSIAGRVTDESGNPIAGAVVRTRFSNQDRQATSGEDGAYRIVGCQPGMTRVVASAKGRAMELQVVRVDSDLGPVNFQLKPGGHVRVRVVDQEDNPVPKARIFFQEWRGRLHYFEFAHVNQYANQQGVWEWNEAPLDEFKAHICPPKGMQLLEQPIIARDEEYVFHTLPPLVIGGIIRDAETRSPVTNYKLTVGIVSQNGHIRWDTNAKHIGSGGDYRLTRDRAERAFLVRVATDGYKVATSREIKSDEGEARIDFKLEKAPSLTARIVTTDNKPALGAKVVLGVIGSQINIRNGDIDKDSTYAEQFAANEEGRFSIPAPDGSFQLVVTHPDGFAHLKSDSPVPAEVRLTRWARVEGTFRVGKDLMPNMDMELYGDAIHSHGNDAPHIFTSYNVKTDDQGHFVLERVFPGRGRIGRRILLMVNDGAKEVTSSLRAPAQFTSGETTRVDIGGVGRVVIGKLAPPASFTGKPLWNFALMRVEVNVAAPAGTKPSRAEALALDKRRDDGPYYFVTIAKDGSFQIDDVPPGEYKLGVSFSPRDARSGKEAGDNVGAIHNYVFGVPEAKENENAPPVDIGVITLKAN